MSLFFLSHILKRDGVSFYLLEDAKGNGVIRKDNINALTQKF